MSSKKPNNFQKIEKKMPKVSQIFKKKISRKNLIGNSLEIALPLSSLLGLKLQGELHQRFMSLVYPLIEVENPMNGLKINQKEKTYLEALLTIEDIPQIIDIKNIEELTLKEIKNDAIYDFDQKFNELRRNYNSLEKDKAKAFINKSLYFILTSKEDPELEHFLKSAKSLPIPQGSDLLFYSNWFLIGDKIKRTLDSSLESIEQRIKGTEHKNGKLRELKEELKDKSKNYIQELKKRMDVAEIQKLILDEQIGSKEEPFLLRIADNLATHSSIILPKLRIIAEHTGKDLNDLIKYQFPDKDRYCVEEGSNSKDAQASYVRFSFFSNGLIIEDNGHAMERQLFYEEYPFPYISIKKEEFNIGRFGVGSKSKHVEVLERNGEVFVESKPENQPAMMQRYFLFNSEMHMGFLKSNKKTRGIKITIISPEKTSEDEANQKSLITKHLKHFNPDRIKVLIENNNVNKNSALRKKEGIETIIYNDEKNRVYFNPDKSGELVLLSGEAVKYETPAPFRLVMEIPLQFQPIEGRNDFVYTEELKNYLADAFREAILPKLEGKAKCAEWFVSKKLTQNPFYQFEQVASKEEITRFYKTLHPQKEITQESKIVNIPRGDTAYLNEIASDLFLEKRPHKPDYLLSIEEYSRLTEKENSQKVEETKFCIKRAMAKHETGITFSDGCLVKNNRKITPAYVTELDHEDPFYFNRENNFLLINMNHKAFNLRDEERKDFYISQILKVAING